MNKGYSLRNKEIIMKSKYHSKNKIYSCVHEIPLISIKILSDIISLDLLSPNELPCLSFTFEFLSSNKQSCNGKTFLKYNLDYSINFSGNAVECSYPSNTIHDINSDCIDFLLSINHKVFYIDDLFVNKGDLHNIINRHSGIKSLILFDNKVYISKTKTINGRRLKKVYCKNMFLKRISDFLLSLPDNGIYSSEEIVLPYDIYEIIQLERFREKRMKMYLNCLTNFKREYCLV